MKRLVIDARESGTSTGRYVDKLIEHLHRIELDYEVIVLTKEPRVDFIHAIAPNFKVVVSPYKEFSFGEQLGLAWQLYRLKADLVHFAMTQQPILYFRPAVTTVHDLTTARFYNPAKNWLVYKIKQYVYRLVIIAVAHKSKSLITPTEFVAGDLAKFSKIRRSKIKVTHEAADKIIGDPEPIAGLVGQKFISYVGRATPHKNLRRLIEAFKKIGDGDLKLVLAGKTDSNYEKLKTFAVDQNLTSQVIFTGFINEQRLKWLYQHTILYTFPSLSEGFGLPSLEAMAHGAPVVSSNATCLPEVNGKAALYFDPLDVDEMASVINRVLQSDEVRNNLVKAGAKQAAKYSWDKLAHQTKEVYDKYLTS